MKRELMSLVGAFCLSVSICHADKLSNEKLMQEYVTLCSEWKAAEDNQESELVAERFLALGGKSDEFTIKARCMYNAATIYLSLGDSVSSRELLESVVIGFQTGRNSGRSMPGERAAYEYAGYALRDLYDMAAKSGKDPTVYREALASDFALSDAAASFVMDRNMELNSGRIDHSKWQAEVTSFLESSAHFHRRFLADFAVGADIASSRHRISDYELLQGYYSVETAAANHAGVMNSPEADVFNERKEAREDSLADSRLDNIRFRSIQDLPKLQPNEEE